MKTNETINWNQQPDVNKLNLNFDYSNWDDVSLLTHRGLMVGCILRKYESDIKALKDLTMHSLREYVQKTAIQDCLKELTFPVWLSITTNEPNSGSFYINISFDRGDGQINILTSVVNVNI